MTEWRFGFRWCESCFCKCQSSFCMENDVCSQIVNHGTCQAHPGRIADAAVINAMLKSPSHTQKNIVNKEEQVKAEELQHCADLLNKYIRCLKGEEQDLTGLGIQRIFFDSLERVLHVKIITEWQWEAFVELDKRQRHIEQSS